MTSCCRLFAGFPLRLVFIAILFIGVAPINAVAEVSNSAAGQDSAQQVLKEFTDNDRAAKSEIVAIPDQRKRLIMFIMGIPLLIFIIITVCLGVAMVVYGKQVFVAHMIFAGLSLTLALGHAVVGVVWFNPF